MRPPAPGQHRRTHGDGHPHPHRRGTDRVDVARLLTVGGEMAGRIGAFDWGGTPLGPIQDWPISLRATAAMVLENRFPMTLFWGRDLLHLYNDAYVAVRRKSWTADCYPNCTRPDARPAQVVLP